MPKNDKTYSRKITIQNELGLHARAAAKFVKTVMSHNAEVNAQRGTLNANGRSILGLMMLAATKNAEVLLQAKGPEAEKVLAALSMLINDKFGEEQ